MIRVKPRYLDDVPIAGLVSIDSHLDVEIVAGETIGYYCLGCGQSDESLEEIIHGEDCSLAGRHGRACYGDHPVEDGPISHDSKGELRHDTRFTLIEWGWTDTDKGIYDGSYVGVRCDECHSMDEHLFEIVHDSCCCLSECNAQSMRV